MQPATAKSPDTRAAVERFLAAARRPVVMEPGEDAIPIQAGNFVLETRQGRVTLECWSASRNLVRRLRAVARERPGRLELETERFGGRKGVLLLLDLAHPAALGPARKGGRLKYREQLRLSLRRQFPEWRLAELSTESDLEHSLSPAYPRAMLRKGSAAIAAIGAAEDNDDPDGALSFGLIWLDYLRRREPGLAVGGLALFLPVGAEVTTCHRVRYLDRERAQYEVFVYGAGGAEEAVDPQGYTNFTTKLEPYRLPPAGFAAPREETGGWRTQRASWLTEPAGRVAEMVERLAAIPGVELRNRSGGQASLLVRGLEFARTSGDELLFGIDRRHVAGDSHLREIEELARGLLRLRSAGAADRTNPLYVRQPEAWLEAQVRAAIGHIDPLLRAAPLYGQAPEFAAGHRAILDVLACGYDGRLAVIEVKASQDIHLPLQALDYWMRVKWHLERGEFRERGYFPGVGLRADAPRILLVAPALEFHPSNETVLRYLSPEVEMERIGIGMDWRRELRVMFRKGAGRR